MIQDTASDEGDFSRRSVLKAGALASLGLVLGPAALAACSDRGSSSTGASEPLLMSHLIANLLIFTETYRAYQAAAAALDFKTAFTSHDGDVQKSLAQVQTFPQLGVKGVHTYQVADPPIAQYAQTLADNKIMLYDMSNRLPWFSPSDSKLKGYYLGNAMPPAQDETFVGISIMVERGGSKGDMIVIRGPKGSYVENARFLGVQGALAKYPNVRMVASAYCDWNQDKARATVESLLSAHPDVKFIACENDDMALGAMAAVKALRNTKALVSGVDGAPPVLELMTKEEQMTVTSAGLVSFQAVFAVTKFFDSMHGVKFNPLEDFINTDGVVVDTKDAAAELLNIAGPDVPIPWDAKKMSRHLNGDNWILPHRLRVVDVEHEEWATGTSNPTPRPADFKWPDAYQKALDNDLASVRSDWDARFVDTYKTVRGKAEWKNGILGSLVRANVLPGLGTTGG
jgi:ABC-type sugar transport system substrate-binding protein